MFVLLFTIFDMQYHDMLYTVCVDQCLYVNKNLSVYLQKTYDFYVLL